MYIFYFKKTLNVSISVEPKKHFPARSNKNVHFYLRVIFKIFHTKEIPKCREAGDFQLQ